MSLLPGGMTDPNLAQSPYWGLVPFNPPVDSEFNYAFGIGKCLSFLYHNAVYTSVSGVDRVSNAYDNTQYHNPLPLGWVRDTPRPYGTPLSLLQDHPITDSTRSQRVLYTASVEGGIPYFRCEFSAGSGIISSSDRVFSHFLKFRSGADNRHLTDRIVQRFPITVSDGPSDKILVRARFLWEGFTAIDWMEVTLDFPTIGSSWSPSSDSTFHLLPSGSSYGRLTSPASNSGGWLLLERIIDLSSATAQQRTEISNALSSFGPGVAKDRFRLYIRVRGLNGSENFGSWGITDIEVKPLNSEGLNKHSWSTRSRHPMVNGFLFDMKDFTHIDDPSYIYPDLARLNHEWEAVGIATAKPGTKVLLNTDLSCHVQNSTKISLYYRHDAPVSQQATNPYIDPAGPHWGKYWFGLPRNYYMYVLHNGSYYIAGIDADPPSRYKMDLANPAVRSLALKRLKQKILGCQSTVHQVFVDNTLWQGHATRIVSFPDTISKDRYYRLIDSIDGSDVFEEVTQDDWRQMVYDLIKYLRNGLDSDVDHGSYFSSIVLVPNAGSRGSMSLTAGSIPTVQVSESESLPYSLVVYDTAGGGLTENAPMRFRKASGSWRKPTIYPWAPGSDWNSLFTFTDISGDLLAGRSVAHLFNGMDRESLVRLTMNAIPSHVNFEEPITDQNLRRLAIRYLLALYLLTVDSNHYLGLATSDVSGASGTPDDDGDYFTHALYSLDLGQPNGRYTVAKDHVTGVPLEGNERILKREFWDLSGDNPRLTGLVLLCPNGSYFTASDNVWRRQLGGDPNAVLTYQLPSNYRYESLDAWDGGNELSSLQVIATYDSTNSHPAYFGMLPKESAFFRVTSIDDSDGSSPDNHYTGESVNFSGQSDLKRYRRRRSMKSHRLISGR